MLRYLVVSVCAAVALVGSTWSGDVGILKPHGAWAYGAPVDTQIETQACPGDFDGDWTVSLADFLVFARAFGTTEGEAGFDSRMDLDGSGAVELADFLAFAAVFGTECEAPPRVVSIPDANLRAVIEDSLGKSPGAAITAAEMAGLSRLEAPNREIRDLTGLAYATGLTFLDLGDERVSGKPPANSNDISDLQPLSGLTILTRLDLAYNSVTDVSVLSELSNLQYLSLNNNDLTSIPSELGRLTSLQRLYLVGNELTGSIPPELGDLTNLRSLFLSANQLTGSIPPELGDLTNLQYLWLNINELTGAIPSELGNLTNLKRLILDVNADLSGPLPGSFTGLDSLSWLSLRGTNLCAPTEAAFQAWLQGIERKFGVLNCTGNSGGGSGGSVR